MSGKKHKGVGLLTRSVERLGPDYCSLFCSDTLRLDGEKGSQSPGYYVVLNTVMLYLTMGQSILRKMSLVHFVFVQTP